MKSHPAWLTAGLLVFAVLACSHSASIGYKTVSLNMAKDDGNEQPGAETKTFSPTDHVIHCVGKLSEAKDGTKVTFTWWAIDAGDSKNEKIKELDYTTKGEENIVHAHLSLPRDWPKGKYKCELAVNGASDRSVEYTVE
jgi:hypothetical protein